MDDAKMEEQESEWEAEEDVRTLIRANEIKGDKKRLARARKKAKQLSEELRGV